ncbi:MAG: hypothetical protein HY707_09450 [Ignavibacteriae bacterium]|nr:hypothetical protein [Ignavibacteriota bacterium]
MELKKVISNYNDAILPISRREIANMLLEIGTKKNKITEVEQDLLEDLYVEFCYDLTGLLNDSHSLFNPSGRSLGSAMGELFTEKEKFLYAYADTNASLFVDGLLTLDARGYSENKSADQKAQFVQFGGRIRGSVNKKLGYYIQGTNAQFWGNRKTLQRDRIISQSYEIGVSDAQNFDFVDGYARYDAGIASLQVGKERVLWGNGYGDKLILSENPRAFDFLRLDVQYNMLKYTFLHAWLLGTRSTLSFTLLSDTLSRFEEPIVADKYFAAHRVEFSFPFLFDLGFQEVVIYSNRSPDLAYLNPLTLMESAQRSREERDNVLWAVDVQTHFLSNVELQGTVFFDDINFPKWGTNDVQNKYAYQIGAIVVDPLLFTNTMAAIEYTRVEPFTFSHARSRDNNYGSLGHMLGHHIGPNADSWFFRVDHSFSHKVRVTFAYEVQRKGENVYDSTGKLIENVGSDFLQPHRSVDSAEKVFLSGNLVRTHRFQTFFTYEVVNEVFLDLHYNYEEESRNRNVNSSTVAHDYGIALRFDI